MRFDNNDWREHSPSEQLSRLIAHLQADPTDRLALMELPVVQRQMRTLEGDLAAITTEAQTAGCIRRAQDDTLLCLDTTTGILYCSFACALTNGRRVDDMLMLSFQQTVEQHELRLQAGEPPWPTTCPDEHCDRALFGVREADSLPLVSTQGVGRLGKREEPSSPPSKTKHGQYTLIGE